MGDVPLAHGDRQSTTYMDHENATQQLNTEQPQAKAFASSDGQPSGPQAAFFSQLDAFSQAAPLAPSHMNSYSGYSPQAAMHRFDLNPLGAALPEGSPSHARAFPQQTPPFTRGIPVQSPSAMNFRTPQMPQYGSQQPFANMPMHASLPRGQPHLQAMPPHFYGQYATPLQPPVQANPGFSPMMAGPYGKPDVVTHQLLSQTYPGLVGRDTISESSISYPRGPPRKPKQSGHALWVGNLPPGTTITALKDHFSREATRDIESLFLISKSNCAFVNYRTEEACAAAMTRFHDSRFQGVRLVCRLRRGTSTGSSVQSGGPANAPRKEATPVEAPRKKSSSSDVIIVASSSSQSPKKDTPTETPDGITNHSPARVPDRYFVVKSLTLQDLEASVRNGVWATQSHNEVALNKAFESADSVYLIFSANKSGEYFGYARMAGPIAPESFVENPKPQPERKDTDSGPKSIPTPATQWAPKGRIVDDSARGTIFWEADTSDTEGEVDGVAPSPEEPAGAKQAQDWGKPFKIEWLSTNRLAFYRTRGLRNPWNENREIKIARDGTEIEPGVGQRLIQMFHRPAPLPQGVPPMHSGMQFPN